MTGSLPPIPIADQMAKLERLLDERVVHYRRGVTKGRLAIDVAAFKHHECESIRRSFRFLVDNHEWIRAEALRRNAERRAIEAAESDPAVAATLAAFPDAEIAAVRTAPRLPAGSPQGESEGASQMEPQS